MKIISLVGQTQAPPHTNDGVLRVAMYQQRQKKLLDKLKKYEGNRFETRAFSYLDVISWLESKIENVPVMEIIRRKFVKRK